jgi:hypothetical protein
MLKLRGCEAAGGGVARRLATRVLVFQTAVSLLGSPVLVVLMIGNLYLNQQTVPNI